MQASARRNGARKASRASPGVLSGQRAGGSRDARRGGRTDRAGRRRKRPRSLPGSCRVGAGCARRASRGLPRDPASLRPVLARSYPQGTRLKTRDGLLSQSPLSPAPAGSRSRCMDASASSTRACPSRDRRMVTGRAGPAGSAALAARCTHPAMTAHTESSQPASHSAIRSSYLPMRTPASSRARPSSRRFPAADRMLRYLVGHVGDVRAAGRSGSTSLTRIGCGISPGWRTGRCRTPWPWRASCRPRRCGAS
jgi:hypothetical protein